MGVVDGANGNASNSASKGNASNGSAGGAPKVGSKLECPSCGAVIVIVKAPDHPISCCGKPLGAPAAEGASHG